MAIIKKPGTSRRPQETDDEVPFVIDRELVERERNTLSPDTIVAIGTALHAIVPDDAPYVPPLWQSSSRIEQISRRVPRGRK